MPAGLLWLMVVAMGVFQGCNPPMGWLPALARGLETRRALAPFGVAARYAFGHFLAIVVVLAPVAALIALVLRDPAPLMPAIGAAMVGFGLFKCLRPRHPRFLARIPPRRALRWSFLMSLTHCGSPLMMLATLIDLIWREPVYFRLRLDPLTRLTHDLGAAFLIALVMSATLLAASSAIAAVLGRTIGLRALARVWINFDLPWSFACIAMGLMALVMGEPRLAALCGLAAR